VPVSSATARFICNDNILRNRHLDQHYSPLLLLTASFFCFGRCQIGCEAVYSRRLSGNDAYFIRVLDCPFLTTTVAQLLSADLVNPYITTTSTSTYTIPSPTPLLSPPFCSVAVTPLRPLLSPFHQDIHGRGHDHAPPLLLLLVRELKKPFTPEPDPSPGDDDVVCLKTLPPPPPFLPLCKGRIGPVVNVCDLFKNHVKAPTPLPLPAVVDC